MWYKMHNRSGTNRNYLAYMQIRHSDFVIKLLLLFVCKQNHFITKAFAV